MVGDNGLSGTVLTNKQWLIIEAVVLSVKGSKEGGLWMIGVGVILDGLVGCAAYAASG
jgi:hypothetical protein